MNVLTLKYVIGRTDANNLMETRFSNSENFIYNTGDTEKESVIKAFAENKTGFVYIAILGYNTEERKITKIWIGKATQREYTLKLNIKAFKLLNDIEESKKFRNLYEKTEEDSIELEDIPAYLFVKNVPIEEFFHLAYDLSNRLINQKVQSLYQYNTFSKEIEPFVYHVENYSRSTQSLAQKSQYAKRPIGSKDPDRIRNEFQRDKERIVHSKSFRRIVDKAQVYNTTKGDHYRKRLTHTLEVAQIARAIARRLNLHEDLTEAIALGHDIGHTPFGHEGERELNGILAGKLKLADFHEPENLGGFKHNYQGVRLANYLEEKYAEYEGLDLTYQVLEGILKHTKIKRCKMDERECTTCLNKCFDINQFLIIGETKELHLDQDFCSTLEGQVVAISDEIAQRGHDIDDGIASGVLSIEELVNELEKNDGMRPLLELIYEVLERINNAKRTFIDKKDLQRAELTPVILSFFIDRLVASSEERINLYSKKHKNFDSDPVIKESLIYFEENDKLLIDELERVINLRIINSQEVNCFDGKSAYIIRKLFKAYYCNPRQLPDNVINRINREINLLEFRCVDIRKGKKDDVEKEIELYQGIRSSKDDIADFMKQKIFMRNIADFIGGMTDEFANEQFKKLYVPN